MKRHNMGVTGVGVSVLHRDEVVGVPLVQRTDSNTFYDLHVRH